MPLNQKKILIVQTKAPFGSSAIQESLDIVLAAGTFDQQIHLLLEEDACFLLLGDQKPNIIQRKNTSKMLQALPIYGIDTVYVCIESANKRHIPVTSTDLFQFLSKDEIKHLYKESDTVIRF